MFLKNIYITTTDAFSKTRGCHFKYRIVYSLFYCRFLYVAFTAFLYGIALNVGTYLKMNKE